MKSRRVGIVRYTSQFLEDSPHNVLAAFFGQLIPFKVEYLYSDDAFEMTALCEQFQEIPQGCVPLHYRSFVHSPVPGVVYVEFLP